MQCKHFGVCGGCSLPGVPYAEQLLRKQGRLAQLLGRAVPPLIPSPREDRFRSKSAFVFGPEGQGRGLVMGHYAARSKQIVRVDECPVHSDRGNRIALALRDRLIRARIYGVGAQRNGLVRHIIVRTTADDRQAVAMLVVTRNDKALRTPIRGLLASADRPDGFFINIHDKPSPYMVGPETIRIDGNSHVKETIGATSYLVSPTAFFQTNVGAAQQLVKLVVEGVQAPPKKGVPPLAVLDLYSGSGLFALPIAQAGATVTAVEENRQAVKDAEANIRLNRIAGGQVRLVCARVEDVLPRLPPQRGCRAGGPVPPQRGCRAGGPVAADRWDAVVLDPPRQGCPPAVLSGVFETIAPQRAIYVSCNPEALAQDLPVILKAGYLVTHLQAVDMFPHTDHIETVAVFTRG